MGDTPHDMKEVKSTLHAEIKEIREAQIRAAATAQTGCDRNALAHERLISSVNGFKGDRKAAIAIVSVLSILLGGTGTWLVTRTNENADDIHDVRREEQGNAREGFQMAADLRNDVDNNEEHIDNLERLHRIQPDERNRLRPQEK
jgi:hypothetical protein